MKRKYKIILFVLVLTFSAAGMQYGFSKTVDVEIINNRLEDINENISFLKKNHIDTTEFQEKYKDILKTREQYQDSLKNKSRCNNSELLGQMLELKVDIFEAELDKKVASAGRLELLFKIMLLFCTFIGIVFAIYIAVMYNKRK